MNNNEWIKCSIALPIQQPEGWPTYDWVLVTSERLGTGEPWPMSIARYTDKGWDLYIKGECPAFGDTWSDIEEYEITHWMKIPKPLEE